VILHALAVDETELRRRTGWELKPEGACLGELCVALPDGAGRDGTIDARVLSDRLGMPLVHESERGVWALGPASATGRALATAEAPDFVLPDLEGRPFELSSLRGRKVVLTSWASW
jgi:hypothetical protein